MDALLQRVVLSTPSSRLPTSRGSAPPSGVGTPKTARDANPAANKWRVEEEKQFTPHGLARQKTVKLKKNLYENERSSAERNWQCVDDRGNVQGPCSALKVLRWLEAGMFNGRGEDVLFKPVGDLSDPRPLTDTLPDILRDVYIALERQIAPRLTDLRRLISQQKEDEDDELKEVIEEPPMEFSEDVQNTDAAMDIQKLHKSFGSCDLIVWLLPPERRKVKPQRSDICAAYRKKFSPPLKKYKIPVHSALLRICSPVWLTEIVTIEDKMRQRMKYQEVQDRNVLMKYVIRTDFPEAVRSIIRYVYGYHQEITRAADPFLLVAVYKECERLEMDRLRAEILKTLSSPVMNVQPLLSLAHAAEALDVPQLLRECIRILADCSFALFSGMSHVELGPLGLQLLLREDNIQLDELQVYICANAWISQQDLSGCRRSLIRKASSRRRESEAKKDREGDESSKGRRRRKEEEDEQGGGGGKGQDEENLRGGEHEIEDDDADADAQTDSLIMDIYRSIRFDSMSPSQIQACREPGLDTLLLDACLRKFSHTEWTPRVFPWNGNEQFVVHQEGGLYPVLISKKKMEDSHQKSSSSSSSVFWAWALGDPRLINEALWATEIVKTKRGKLHFGIAIEDSKIQGCRCVCYFDYDLYTFVTGLITGGDPRAISYRTTQTGANVKWSRTYQKGDIVVTRVSVGLSVIHLTIQVLQGKANSMTASFMLPLRTPVCVLGKFLQRPFLRVWPFVEAIDPGDTLGVAEILTQPLGRS